MRRYQFFFTIIVTSATASLAAWASEPSGDRYASSGGATADGLPSYGGTLKRNEADKDGTAPFLVVDKWGMIQTYVRPQPGLESSALVGRQVVIRSAGSAIRRDGTRCITADEVALADRAVRHASADASYRQADDQGGRRLRWVRPTAYQEPLENPAERPAPRPATKTAIEPVPAPQPAAAPATSRGAAVAPGRMEAVEPGYDGNDGPPPMVGPGPGCCGSAGCGGCEVECGRDAAAPVVPAVAAPPPDTGPTSIT